MQVNFDAFSQYIAAFFLAWAVGVVTGLVWAWFRSLIGVGE